ncbi:MAG TPA: pyruvate dehydrogenase (acetyl-transferring) E1 component subunit alpha, partial [Polyangiaceae bacterium]|nr:pyruvate dehydrogenase (acetyl-transferring) E1 component subunit alpha [Polyangiaceae bacterium]
DEVEARKKGDAVARSRAELVEKGQTKAIEALEQKIEDEVADAVHFADESPEPGPELLEATTYVGPFAR